MAKKSKKGFWRIIDLETGLYYNRKYVVVNPDAKTYMEQRSRWDDHGDVWKNKGSAESQVTSLTRTFKKDRDTETKIILYGSKETARYRVVEAEIKDKE